jgi:hypothetical protein
MQKHALERVPCGLLLQVFIELEITVFVVTRNRVDFGGQVHSNLVRTSGRGPRLHERRAVEVEYRLLHRDGTVRGNYFDAVSNAVHPVTGRFDRETGSLAWRIGSGGAEFEATAEGLAGGRGEATVRRGTTERPWVLISLP